MVKACEPYHSLSRARLAEHFGAGFAVVGCPRERPAKLEPRAFRCHNPAQDQARWRPPRQHGLAVAGDPYQRRGPGPR